MTSNHDACSNRSPASDGMTSDGWQTARGRICTGAGFILAGSDRTLLPVVDVCAEPDGLLGNAGRICADNTIVEFRVFPESNSSSGCWRQCHRLLFWVNMLAGAGHERGVTRNLPCLKMVLLIHDGLKPRRYTLKVLLGFWNKSDALCQITRDRLLMHVQFAGARTSLAKSR